uniref:Uncharacterized protein n=1 Tax=Catharus ustulatus TaxID=91951 RepID=A0A8C3UPJ0_CATUS
MGGTGWVFGSLGAFLGSLCGFLGLWVSFWGPTSRWGRVKTTGSLRKTLLDSLLMEAAMTWELTTSWGARGPPSPARRTVAFSVGRNSPRLLYRMNTTFTTPGETAGEGHPKTPPKYPQNRQPLPHHPWGDSG